MSDIVIEHGVPLPTRPRSKYPFAQMRVGDSFSVGFSARDTVKTSASQFIRANPGWKFTVRSLANGETRVWCVARPADDQPMRVGGAAR